mgnify:CR=1 FL=1
MNDNVIIQAEKVQKYFNGGAIKALDGVSAQIQKGEVVVVIGPSGSGKSTFLRCLNLLELPTGGKIFFKGADITNPKADINLYRQKIITRRKKHSDRKNYNSRYILYLLFHRISIFKIKNSNKQIKAISKIRKGKN